jgi:hypothetical protein
MNFGLMKQSISVEKLRPNGPDYKSESQQGNETNANSQNHPLYQGGLGH